jgi:signal transduction histidine kinase
MAVLARPPRPRLRPLQIRALLSSTAALVGEGPALNAVRIEVEGDDATISADPGLLQIVFLNLLVNGAQAVGRGGAIRITVDSADSDCRVRVKDNGPGIVGHIREKIFTPFFTTN